MLFASHHSTIQSYNPNSRNKLSSKFSLEINAINQFNNNMPSKKGITRFRFNDVSRAANQRSSTQNLTRLASHLTITAPQVSEQLRITLPAPRVLYRYEHQHLLLIPPTLVLLSHPAHMYPHMTTLCPRFSINL